MADTAFKIAVSALATAFVVCTGIHAAINWSADRAMSLIALPALVLLISTPILTLVTLLIIRLNISSWPAYALEVVVGVPVCIAGAYLFHLVQNHPFIDGNKRVGAAAADVFLALNDLQLTATEYAYANFVLSVAKGETRKAAIAEFFRANVQSK